MSVQHTRGPWRISPKTNGVVADHPVSGMPGSEEVEYYGGHLIAESISSENLPIIAAAPDLLAACIKARASLATAVIANSGGIFDDMNVGDHIVVHALDAAIAKATTA